MCAFENAIMPSYIPQNECDQLSFADFVRTPHQFCLENIHFMSVFSFYQKNSCDICILYKKNTYFIDALDFKSLPHEEAKIAFVIPYSCPTARLPYASEFLLQDDAEAIKKYKKFWRENTLETCLKKSYLYDPRQALGLYESRNIFGDVAFFEVFFTQLLAYYEDIVVASSFWDLHGLGDIRRRFKNKPFKREFPILNALFEKRTVNFNASTAQQRIEQSFSYFENFLTACADHEHCPLKEDQHIEEKLETLQTEQEQKVLDEQIKKCDEACDIPCDSINVSEFEKSLEAKLIDEAVQILPQIPPQKFEEECETNCTFAPVHIAGIVHWKDAFETLTKYVAQGGAVTWHACDVSCGPSIVTLCPDMLVDAIDNKNVMQVLVAG